MERRIVLPSVVFCVALGVIHFAQAIDRDTIMEIAESYATHQWTCTAANTKATCSASYASDYSPGTYTGVCYDWGGYKTLAEFDSELTQGYGAGSHSKNGVLSCTTGVDCSGFVSKCWKESHYGTSTLSQISTAISKTDIKKGDVFNNAGSHVVLFSYFSQTGAPVFYEASGSASKVRLNTTGGWSYLNGYTPRRYNNITEVTNPKLCAAPTVISLFPYSNLQNTQDSGCDKFDAYSCSPATNEKGPEVVYQFEALKPGTITASLTSGPGVDIDIHLLSSLDANACIARNNTKISVHIEAGKYYLVADTYVSSSGKEYSGPYQLDADFVADVAADAGQDEDVAPGDSNVTPKTGEARGSVYEDKGSGEADMSTKLTGAIVTVVETGDTATAAGADASWSFTLEPKTYTIKASMTGYEEGKKVCTVTASNTTWCSIGLKKKQVTQQKGTARGMVYEDTGAGDADMSIKLTGATVTVVETGDTATADSSTALWSFSLNPGTYTIKASMTGYQESQRSCTVTANAEEWCSIGLKKVAAEDGVIAITSFPYTDSRSTKNSTHDQFNTYSCSTTGEKGPEVIYSFEVTKSGSLTATVTDGTGVDVDIHLLSKLDPNACLARNDTTFTKSITAGKYYLVVDTYSNSSGTEYPGQYTLNVSFVPDEATEDGVIDITSFPYTDSRNTADSTHDQFNTYSCSTTGEKGPEVIYSFEVTKSGSLTATVTDGTGVDVDIHLLSKLDPNACLARNDTTFTKSITAGKYYLVVDTYSNSSGTEYPGQYTLNVSFVPDE